MAVDPATFGCFDLTLYVGVLYHMENPRAALRKVTSLTREVAIVETSAIYIPRCGRPPLRLFHETDDLNADPTNWWSVTDAAMLAMCRAAGFKRVDLACG